MITEWEELIVHYTRGFIYASPLMDSCPRSVHQTADPLTD